MLLNYKAKNFGSFKDELDFSMKTGRYMSRFEDNVIRLNSSLKISRFTVIAGENAGGKTSFIRSIDFLKFCILESKAMRILEQLAHRYNTENSQFFEISILADDKIYTYYLEIDKEFIVKENLKIRNKDQDVDKDIVIFESTRHSIDPKQKVYMDIKINQKFIIPELETIIKSNDSLTNGSTVNYLHKLKVSVIKPFIEWIEEKLIVEIPDDANLNVYKSMENNKNDLEIMHYDTFLEIIQLIDSSIVEIIVDKLEPYNESVLVRRDMNDDEFNIKLKYESSGTKEFFAWAVQLWKVIYADSILFADEIDKVLNPILSAKIISYIKGSEHRGQFIFSTHNAMHLNTNDYMKEQIYFITKDGDNLSSEIYSLADFKDYRYEKSNVYELYFKGLLGGVPNS